MRAIDLYSGIGGWHLGLKMAQIEVVNAYEWWDKAVETYNNNFGCNIVPTDIRKMKMENLPTDILFVVGSPPCTEFSYANRGGNGNIAEGLKDIYKFLEIVEYLHPKYWAMENVPRVSGIIEQEIAPSGSLERFKDLFTVNEIVNAADYGLPQARKRMIAGNFPWKLFATYKTKTRAMSLGEAIGCFGGNGNLIIDPIYGTTLPRQMLLDHDKEAFLDDEEVRMNREAKQYHPVYNVMNFPDSLSKPSRTVTGTCTRVSRESIIVEDNKLGKYRRLTVRERALLQGFPLSYQIFGKTHSEKLKMVGNAIPPVLTYFIACSMLEKSPEEVRSIIELKYNHPMPPKLPLLTNPETVCKRYPMTRKFRAAISNLRFGSGMRFELANDFDPQKGVSWKIGFYFGTSKDIKRLDLSGAVATGLVSRMNDSQTQYNRMELESLLRGLNATDLQSAWNRSTNAYHPYKLVDALGEIAKRIQTYLYKTYSQKLVEQWVEEALFEAQKDNQKVYSSYKGVKYADWILAGIMVGVWFNSNPMGCDELADAELVG